MPAAATFARDLRTVLRGRGFRRLFATRLVSQLGDGAFQVGLASVFFFSPERAATASAAAAGFAVGILPYTIVGPFAGVLLDRWRRRQILLVANAVRAVLVVGAAALVAGHAVGPPLYLVVLLCLSVNRFFLSGLSAGLPHVVTADELVMANAVSPTSGTMAALAGAAVGYGLQRGLGTGDGTDAAVLVAAATAYLGSSLLALRMAPDLLGPDGAHAAGTGAGSALRAVARGIADGARHVRERSAALHALAAVGAHRFVFGLTTVSVLLLCRNHFNDPADAAAGLALLVSVVALIGAGYAVAALITPVATRRTTPQLWICTCFLVAGVVQGLLVVTVTVPLMLVAAFVLGVAGQSAKICVDAIIQVTVDDAFRGRVFSFYDVVFNAAFVAAAAIGAAVLPPDGYSRPVLAVTALVYLGAAAAYLRTTRRAGRLVRPPVPVSG